VGCHEQVGCPLLRPVPAVEERGVVARVSALAGEGGLATQLDVVHQLDGRVLVEHEVSECAIPAAELHHRGWAVRARWLGVPARRRSGSGLGWLPRCASGRPAARRRWRWGMRCAMRQGRRRGSCAGFEWIFARRGHPDAAARIPGGSGGACARWVCQSARWIVRPRGHTAKEPRPLILSLAMVLVVRALECFLQTLIPPADSAWVPSIERPRRDAS
jgi:hypothetical protein